MDRPIRSPFGIFAGAVERIDDPDPHRRQPRRIVRAFLREDGVAGPPLGEAGENQIVGDPVGGTAERGAREDRALALREQQAARFRRQMRGQVLVGQRPLPLSPLSRVNGFFTIFPITVFPAGDFSRGD